MKKIILIASFLIFTLFAFAQEKSKQKEIGLSFHNLDNFGLSFKIGTEKSMWRFTTLLLSGANKKEEGDSVSYTRANKGIRFGFGKEYRKNITDNLDFRFGADLSFSYQYSDREKDDKSVNNYDDYSETKIFTPGLNLVLGLNYTLNDHFVIGAELLPYFTYDKGTKTQKDYYVNDGEKIETDISGFNYGISNSSVLLTIAYKF